MPARSVHGGTPPGYDWTLPSGSVSTTGDTARLRMNWARGRTLVGSANVRHPRRATRWPHAQCRVDGPTRRRPGRHSVSVWIGPYEVSGRLVTRWPRWSPNSCIGPGQGERHHGDGRGRHPPQERPRPSRGTGRAAARISYSAAPAFSVTPARAAPCHEGNTAFRCRSGTVPASFRRRPGSTPSPSRHRTRLRIGRDLSGHGRVDVSSRNVPFAPSEGRPEPVAE